MRISDWSSDVCSSDLHMSSGLEHVENGDPVWQGDTVAMLFGDGAGDMAGFAEAKPAAAQPGEVRSEEHTSELQSLMRISYAVFCLKKKIKKIEIINNNTMRIQM